MASGMIVGQFNDSFKPIMDGVGLCVENYTRWLDAKYGTAYAIVPHVPGYEDDDPFTVVRYPSLPIPVMPPYRLGIPWASPEVGKLLAWTGFDLVHSHSPFVAGRMARRTAEEHDVPHVTTFHTKYRDDIRRFSRWERLTEIIVKRIVRFYDGCHAVWTPSEATRETLWEYGYEGEITVAPNGSDLARPTDAERRRYRREGGGLIGAEENAFVFLFVGQHRWEKNVELIIRGIGRLAERDDLPAAFLLAFAGEGYAAADMASMVRQVGIAEQTRFLGKIVDRETMKALYARADLFLFPSVYDNAPLVMREAAAFGVPTVVAEGSSAAEVVCDGETGFVVANDPDAMADALARLMRNRELVERAGRGAADSIYRSWEEIVDWAAGEYERIIAAYD
ncbi:MAG: glycosyltransferase [Spirochaetota bacterium]